MKETVDIIRDLRSVEHEYADRFVGFGEVNISHMARDCADVIESLQAQLKESQEEAKKQHYLAFEMAGRADEAQRREKAAVGDMKLIVDAVREEYCDETCCFACAFDCDTSINDSGVPNCECPGFERDDCFEWRGPQEAGVESR